MCDSPSAADRPPKPRHRRLHWLTWLAIVATTAALGVVVPPGMPSEAGPEFRPPSPDLPMPAPWTLVQTWEHGWPWTFLTREVPYAYSPSWQNLAIAPPAAGEFDYDPQHDRTLPLEAVRLRGEPIAWTAPVAWRFAGGESRRWRWGAAAADLTVCIVLVSLAAWAVERWRRRRGSLVRWRLADLLAAVALAAGVMGWARYHQLHHATNQRVDELFQEICGAWWNAEEARRSYLFQLAYWGPTAATSPDETLPPLERPQWREWEFVGPQWLARLVGSRELLSNCWRLRPIDRRPNRMTYSFAGSATDARELSASSDLSTLRIAAPECLIEDLQPLTRVPTLRRLELRIAATEEEVRQFLADNNLEGRVELDPASTFVQPDNVALRRLRRRLKQEGPEPGNVDPRYLSLASLDMDDKTLQKFAPYLLENVRRLRFGPTKLTLDDWAIIGRCRYLEELDTGDATLSGRELAVLRPLLLRELSLRQGDLTVEDFKSLAAIKSLVAVTVRDATFTDAEQAELRNALPDADLEFRKSLPPQGAD